jgi:hypothetical protein
MIECLTALTSFTPTASAWADEVGGLHRGPSPPASLASAATWAPTAAIASVGKSSQAVRYSNKIAPACFSHTE